MIPIDQLAGEAISYLQNHWLAAAGVAGKGALTEAGKSVVTFVTGKLTKQPEAAKELAAVEKEPDSVHAKLLSIWLEDALKKDPDFAGELGALLAKAKGEGGGVSQTLHQSGDHNAAAQAHGTGNTVIIHH